VEIALRLWAHRPFYFFCGYHESFTDIKRWLNTADFLIVLVDILEVVIRAARHFAIDQQVGEQTLELHYSTL
jgi:hypothetical protein